MTKSGYMVLKDHFDKLFTTPYNGTRCENIRDTFKNGLGVGIGDYDVYTTNISIANNPVNCFTTIVGADPEDFDIPTGIIPSYKELHSVNFIDREYFLGLFEENTLDYFVTVFDAIENILQADSLYSIRISLSNPNPYLEFLHMLPIYIAFNHVRYVDADRIEVLRKPILNWLEKFACDSMEDAKNIYNSMVNNKYYDTFEKIYKVITCDNNVILFG